MMKFSMGRQFKIILWSILSAGLVSIAALALLELIQFVTNIAFFAKFSLANANPADNSSGVWVVIIPVVGGLIVGWMARYGSPAIRGHGIPEAMQQILQHRSRIAPRVAILKPLSAAISIGTGGPFGAEGPIIATGGAIGSLVGQFFSTTAVERKILLASGAAAGMTFIFGTPVAAVLLAIELLLFEFRSRSIIPVSLACGTAIGLRTLWYIHVPMFPMKNIAPPDCLQLLILGGMGVFMGFISAGMTWMVYWVEDQFEKLPIHWMWWPALGGVVVGGIGWFIPTTLGVGYANIENLVQNKLTWQVALLLGAGKFISWVISLGSGTSGGTLAPLLTLGGVIGTLFAVTLNTLYPPLSISPELAALVGMAALFAGASRAMLASIVFASEVTGQPNALPALLVACAISHFISKMIMKNSIMTEKIERRGISIPSDYLADPFQHVRVDQVMQHDFPVLRASDTIHSLMERMARHDSTLANLQTFPVISAERELVGMVSRSNLLQAQEEENLEACVLSVAATDIIFTCSDETVHDAIEKMFQYHIGSLPVVNLHNPKQLIGLLTKNSILETRRVMSEEDIIVEAGWNRTDSKYEQEQRRSMP